MRPIAISRSSTILSLPKRIIFFFRNETGVRHWIMSIALLSFLYTLLVHDIRSALETTGLDPAVGFLHRDRPGRPGLALDMMEEFRPFLADRLVFSLINLRQVQGKGFKKSESGAVMMTDDTRKNIARGVSGEQTGRDSSSFSR